MPGMQTMVTLVTQWFAPSQVNPMGLNPLRRLLEREVDFELLAHQQRVKVFVNATNVRTGQGEIFTGGRLSADAMMASACLPTLYQAVEIDGERYWDGGFSGNPSIYPLIYHTRSADVLLVQINPIEAACDPGAGAREIVERINEITFNAPLVAEFRAIDFVTRLLDEGRLDTSRYKRMLMHRVDGGAALARLNANSKLRADSAFVRRLFTRGREAGQAWLQAHFDDVGQRSSIEFPREAAH